MNREKQCEMESEHYSQPIEKGCDLKEDAPILILLDKQTVLLEGLDKAAILLIDRLARICRQTKPDRNASKPETRCRFESAVAEHLDKNNNRISMLEESLSDLLDGLEV